MSFLCTWQYVLTICICSQYVQKIMGDETDFCLYINTKVFYELIDSLLMCIARHAQSTQDNNFTIYLQYFKENVKDEVDLLPADKRQKFLQSDTIILGVCGQASPNYPKSQVRHFSALR